MHTLGYIYAYRNVELYLLSRKWKCSILILLISSPLHLTDIEGLHWVKG